MLRRGGVEMWDAMVIASMCAISAERAKREVRAEHETLSSRIGFYGTAPASVSAKCPCCGSRQFVVHQARRVCSYCRSEQDGQAVSSGLSPESAIAILSAKTDAIKTINQAYDFQFGHSVLRPDTAVRITKSPA